MNETLEDICYEAYRLGLRDELFEEVGKLRKKYPHMEIPEMYDKAFRNILDKRPKGSQK